jgi:hypothetical protein
MPTNPYAPSQEAIDAKRRSMRVPFIAFALTALLILAVDAGLYSWMHPDNPEMPLGTWMLVNLPGMPLAMALARRSEGEHWRILLRSAIFASCLWGLLAGIACHFLQKRR